MNTTDQFNETSLAWIEHLALEELNMNESGVISIDDHLNPSALLEDSSIRFMDTLRDKFDFYVTAFRLLNLIKNTGSVVKNLVGNFGQSGSRDVLKLKNNERNHCHQQDVFS